MNDVVYEYGCEVTSTKECPLNEEIKADERAKIINIIENCCWRDAEMLVELIKEQK